MLIVSQAVMVSQQYRYGQLRTADGLIAAECSMSAEFVAAGRRLAVSAFRRIDTRNEVLREIALREAIEKALPNGIACVSDDGIQTYVNPKLCEMLGWTQDELVGRRPPFVYWPPEEHEHILNLLQQATAGQVREGGAEVTLMRRSGERFPAQLMISRMNQPEEPGWLAYVIDISEKKRLQAQSEEARRLEALGRLAGEVAHDFNNILAVVV